MSMSRYDADYVKHAAYIDQELYRDLQQFVGQLTGTTLTMIEHQAKANLQRLKDQGLMPQDLECKVRIDPYDPTKIDVYFDYPLNYIEATITCPTTFCAHEWIEVEACGVTNNHCKLCQVVKEDLE